MSNVHNAFPTAPSFASAFSSQASDTTVLAHSLGNMVVCSAIQDHGFRPDRYFMLNAAVPAEAFDESEWNDTALFNPMVHQEWVNYPSRTWASHWHNLFQANDIRHGLTWTNRFADVPYLTDLYNYYSTGDEILAVYDTPNADGSGKITIDSVTGGALRNYSWQKQERFKGRAGIDPLAGFGGTSDMGWGFSTLGYWEQGSPPMYDDYYVAGEFVMNHVRTAKYTFAQATAAVNAQLVSDPVFRHGIALGIPSGSMASSEKDVHLARGVPALSGPAGSRAIGVLPQGRNKDINERTDASWPRVGSGIWSGWRHSDIKDIAMPFVFGVFPDISGAMED